MNPGQLSAMFKRLREHPDAGIEHDTAVAIANAAHVNVEWLRFGTGKRDAESVNQPIEAEKALFKAAKELRADLEDFEAARAALKDTVFLLDSYLKRGGDLAEFAKDWVSAAQRLRQEGHPVNAGTIGTCIAINDVRTLHSEVEGLREDLKR